MTAPAASVKAGVEKWQAGEYKAAVTIWQPLAARGDSDALFNLGQAYKLGRGVTQDLAMAKTYYRRAAERGHAPAATNLGILTAQSGDKAESARWWTKAAEAGEARAQYMLGVMYFNGDSVPRKWRLAYAYMTQASNGGFEAASAALQKMNAHIPLDQRQAGQNLAADPERLRTEIPASVIGVALAARAAKPGREASTDAGTKAVKPLPVPAPAAVPVPSAPAVTSVTSTTSSPVSSVAAGPWRVQIGAYGQMTSARQGWDVLRKDSGRIIGSHEPVFSEAGRMIRLQIGGFRERADAQALCNKLTAAGRSCFVVKAP